MLLLADGTQETAAMRQPCADRRLVHHPKDLVLLNRLHHVQEELLNPIPEAELHGAHLRNSATAPARAAPLVKRGSSLLR